MRPGGLREPRDRGQVADAELPPSSSAEISRTRPGSDEHLERLGEFLTRLLRQTRRATGDALGIDAIDLAAVERQPSVRTGATTSRRPQGISRPYGSGRRLAHGRAERSGDLVQRGRSARADARPCSRWALATFSASSSTNRSVALDFLGRRLPLQHRDARPEVPQPRRLQFLAGVVAGGSRSGLALTISSTSSLSLGFAGPRRTPWPWRTTRGSFLPRCAARTIEPALDGPRSNCVPLLLCDDAASSGHGPNAARRSVGEQRHGGPGVAADEHGAGDRGRPEAVADLVERGVERARRSAVERQRELDRQRRRRGSRRRCRQRQPALLDQRQRQRRAARAPWPGSSACARSRAAACASASRA